MHLQITIDLSAVQQLALYTTGYPNVQAEIARQMQFVQQIWAAAVYGGMLPGMTKRIYDETYRNALTTPDALEYPFNGNPFQGAVIARYDGVEKIERGYASFDMKPGLLSGPKSRPTADGQGRYNIVPFRHGTPGQGPRAHMPTMPQAIYEYLLQANREGWDQRQINRSGPGGIPLSEYGRRSKVMMVVNRNWQVRNQDGGTPPMQNNYTWRTGMYAGIQHITKGDRHSAQWMTFRAVSTPRTKTITRGPNRGRIKYLGSDPSSWIHPGQPPNPIMESVFNMVRGQVEQAIIQAAQRDLGTNM